MDSGSASNTIIALLLGAFSIFYVFKFVQFVFQAVNLYKKMIVRQEATIELLLDIRDNTKKFDINSLRDSVEDTPSVTMKDLKACYNCNAQIPVIYKRCPKCGAKMD